MAGHVTGHRSLGHTRDRAHLTEPRFVRWTLIAVGLGFLALFLILPLVTVFVTR